MVYIFLYITLICLIIEVKSELEHCNEAKQSYTICKLIDKYKSNEPPFPHPMNIKVLIFLEKVNDLDEVQNTMTNTIHLKTIWNDSRITFNADKSLEG